MRIRELKLGQWIRASFDDAGVRDGVVVEKDHPSDPKPRSCKVFFPFEGTDRVYADQLLCAGKILTGNANHTGLND